MSRAYNGVGVGKRELKWSLKIDNGVESEALRQRTNEREIRKAYIEWTL